MVVEGTSAEKSLMMASRTVLAGTHLLVSTDKWFTVGGTKIHGNFQLLPRELLVVIVSESPRKSYSFSPLAQKEPAVFQLYSF